MLNFTTRQIKTFKKLNTPAKVQDFLNSIPFNFEENGETAKSPLYVLKTGSAHCLEGAMLGAYILSLHGHKPYLIHLCATKDDFDHIIAPFKIDGFWGALSKTNHAVLRYREPVYKNIRELVMSYFHEYFLNNGKKTLRTYSALYNLNDVEDGWELMDGYLNGIDEGLLEIKHFEIVPKKYIKRLRLAEEIEREAGKIVEYKKR